MKVRKMDGMKVMSLGRSPNVRWSSLNRIKCAKLFVAVMHL